MILFGAKAELEDLLTSTLAGGAGTGDVVIGSEDNNHSFIGDLYDVLVCCRFCSLQQEGYVIVLMIFLWWIVKLLQ